MKFSVLIAHFNNSKYFKDCYDSLLKQTYENWEAIIVDDFSKENEKINLKEIIKNDSRIILIENSENKGVGFTKRRCAENATGEICGFVDPDDALTPDAIEKSIACYQSEMNIATYSKLWVCDGKLIPEKFFPHTRKIKNANPHFFNVRFEVAHFFTFKKEIYDQTSGINTNISSSVDQDLYLKLYELGNFAFIPEPLYLYRIHEKGVSQEKSKKEKLYKNWHIVLEETLQRRKISILFGEKIKDIKSLPEFIYDKQNTIFHKILRKLS